MRTWQMTAAPWYNNIFVPADVDISDYSYLYMLYSTESGSSGMLSIDMSTNFSATVDDWTVTHNVSDNFITVELDGTQIVPVTGKMFTFTGTVASLFNRNEDISISGPMEAFQTGSTEVYHTVSSLKIQPRTWTL